MPGWQWESVSIFAHSNPLPKRHVILFPPHPSLNFDHKHSGNPKCVAKGHLHGCLAGSLRSRLGRRNQKHVQLHLLAFVEQVWVQDDARLDFFRFCEQCCRWDWLRSLRASLLFCRKWRWSSTSLRKSWLDWRTSHCRIPDESMVHERIERGQF